MAAPSIDGLLAEAAAFVEQYEYQAAVDKFHEAYQLEPENTLVLDSLAEVLLEIGHVDDALNISMDALHVCNVCSFHAVPLARRPALIRTRIPWISRFSLASTHFHSI